jgi:hypothetical protein
MEAREVSDGSVLGRDMTIVTGYIKWTGNLPNRADVAARGGAPVARGGVWKMCRTFWGCVMARGILELAEIVQIHRSEAETPLLVVSLAERCHDGGAIGLGSNC